MKKDFFLIDINYRIYKETVYLELFGKILNDEKEQKKNSKIRDSNDFQKNKKKDNKVVLLYNDFLPYFYVELREINQEIIDRIKSLGDSEHKVIRVEKTKKQILDKEKELLKIFVNIPESVPIIKEEIKNNLNVYLRSYEYSIPYVKRFLSDNNFSVCSFYEIDIDETDEEIKSLATKYRFQSYALRGIKEKEIKEQKEISLKILSFDIETYSENREINPEKNPILFISLFSKEHKKVLTHKKFENHLDFIEFFDSEKEMIKAFNEYIKEINPDVLSGYFSDGFDFPYIKKRAELLGVNLDFGYDFSGVYISGSISKNSVTKGIIHLDIYKYIRNVLGSSLETTSYSLQEVSKEILEDTKKDVNLDNLSQDWKKNNSLDKYAEYNLQDSKLCYQLTEKILPQMIEYSKLTSLTLFKVCRASYSVLVESHLLRREKEFNMLAPSKPNKEKLEQRKHKKYEGAFVYQPIPGLYKEILVFDFKSLYPSIIVSYNISPETINNEKCNNKVYVPFEENIELKINNKENLSKVENKKNNVNKTKWICQDKQGFIPYVLKDILILRDSIKNKLKNAKAKEKPFLYAQQLSLKTIANSTYGYLGYPYSMWYCFECASAVTAFGRYHIKEVIRKVEKQGFKVIYGDTDSIFLTLNKRKKEEAIKCIEEINKELPGIMKLELEGYFVTGIFVSIKSSKQGAKKRYALMNKDKEIEIKGFEAIRRNWSLIGKECQETVLRMLLEEKRKSEVVNYLKSLIKDVKEKKVDNTKMILVTQLQKNVDNYESIAPHVAAAKRMIALGYDVFPGMNIDYIVTEKGKKISEKVKLPEECEQGDYDSDYYINNQIIPSVENLLKVVGIQKEEILNESIQSSLSSFMKQ